MALKSSLIFSHEISYTLFGLDFNVIIEKYKTYYKVKCICVNNNIELLNTIFSSSLNLYNISNIVKCRIFDFLERNSNNLSYVS